MAKSIDVTIHVDTRPLRTELRWVAWSLRIGMKLAHVEMWLRRVPRKKGRR